MLSTKFNDILKDVIRSTNAQGAVLVSSDGLPIASASSGYSDEDRIAALSATILSLGEKVASELQRGELEQLYIKGREGYIVYSGINEDAVLGVMASTDTKLGLLFFEMNIAAKKIGNVFKENMEYNGAE